MNRVRNVGSSIPLAYLDMGLLERTVGILPGQQEHEDDLRDHWRSGPHLQERKRLLHRLFNFADQQATRVTLISGKVHLAALAIIESKRSNSTANAAVINQLISSGVVHPAPGAIVRYVLESIADKPETIDRGITSTMQRLGSRGNYLVCNRNWLSLEPDNAGRIWANWYIEDQPHPLTKVIHPVQQG